MLEGGVVDDRFEVQACAGIGGMGTVYRARDRVTDRLVALKVLRDSGEGTTRRFTHEARVLAGLEHPHIVGYVAHGFASSGEPYIAMEWLEGEELDARLRRERLGVVASIELGLRLSRALGAAHAQGVVHRDIKPSNIFLVHGEIERVKILDFGLARLGGKTVLTQTGSVLGTPGYMAPEQARGERGRVDARADVFSLGCVLYECITGQAAFVGGHVMAVLAKVLFEEAPRPRELCPELPEDLDALLVRMLSKNPVTRPADGQEVAEALERVVFPERSAGPIEDAPASLMTNDESRLVSLIAVLPIQTPATPEGVTLQMKQQDVFEVVSRTVKPFKATVEPLAAGGVMALFDGVGNAGDQLTVAARCALRIKELANSEIVALYTGRSSRNGRLAVGEIIDRTAALVQTTSEMSGIDWLASGILIDPTTRSLLGDRFVIAEEAEHWLLQRERAHEDLSRSVLGKSIPCVGRERDLRSLLDFVEEGFDDSAARAILVSGPAGMGKSRLRLELLDRLRENGRDFALISGRGDWLGLGSAFGLIGGALRATCNVDLTHPEDAQRRKLFEACKPCGEAAQLRVAAFLGEMLGVRFPDEEHPRLRAARQNASIMADGIQEAFVDFIRAKVAKSPVVIVLEDLQWGDTPSMRLVDAALRELVDTPLLVVGLGRPELHEVFPGLWQDRMLQSVRLGRLSRKASESLAWAILGDSVDSSRIDAIVERADGNAFFIEELSRAVAEGRAEVLPDTIAGMVEARIMALPSSSRLLLRAASIFGRKFRPDGVAALIHQSLSSTSLTALLDELVNREFLSRKSGNRLAADEEITFRQALIQQAAYAMLTERDRVVGHKLAAEWLESVGEQDPMILAEHFARGGEPTRAIGYYLRAARQAIHGGDARAAMDRASRGIACGALGDLEAGLVAIQSDALMSAGEYKRGLEFAERALDSARLGSSTYCHALGCAYTGALMTGNVEIVRRYGSALLQIEPPEDAIGTTSRALGQAVTLLCLNGATEEAREYLERMVEVIEPSCPTDSYATSWYEYTHAFWCRFVEKDPWRALVHDLTSITHFETIADRRFLWTGYGHVGLDYLLLGAHAESEKWLDRALAGAPVGGMSWDLAAHCKSRLLLETRRLDEAYALASELQKSAAERNSRVIGMNATLTIMETKILRGDLEGAERDLGAFGDPGQIVLSLRPSILSLLGEIRLRQGHAQDAVFLAEQARAACDAAGGTAIVRQDGLALLYVEALDAVGRHDEAKVVLGRLLPDFLSRAEMIGDPSLRQSFLENVPTRARAFELARKWGLSWS